MDIKVHGLPWEDESYCSDAIAAALAKIVKGLTLKKSPVSVMVDFRSRAEAQETTCAQKSDKGSRTDDAIDPASLVCDPLPNAERLRLPTTTWEAINTAIKRVGVRDRVYNEWGISEIDPFGSFSLNFSGPPGTGKTLAAHYIAKRLGKKIIEVSYADVVSKYFGQAAKNLLFLYEFAATQDAILFVDEAETLLSKRTSEGTHGADHAVNSMRSQLLILMGKTPTISIYSSNLIESYDVAFKSRLITVNFPLPDTEISREIWNSHLPERLPRSPDLTPTFLSARFSGLNGREIAKAVVEAAHRAALSGHKELTEEHFDWAVAFVRAGVR